MTRKIRVSVILAAFGVSASQAAFGGTDLAASTGCTPYVYANIQGTYGIGLGNTPPFQDVTTAVADLPTNQIFQICNGTFKDRTEMHVIYNALGAAEQSRRVERNSCFIFNAAQVRIRAIMGGGHTPPEDSVNGRINICRLP